MKVGIFTALLANLSLDDVIQKIKPLGIRTVELGTGNFPGTRTSSSNGCTKPPSSKNSSRSSKTKASPSAL